MRTRQQPQQVVVQSAPQEPRDYRKELWIGVCVGVARAENTKDKNAPCAWADTALQAFDEKFGGKK